MKENQIIPGLESMRSYFRSGKTLPVTFRLEQLKNLKRVLEQNEKKIYEALKKDLRKSETESFLSETFLVMEELNDAIRHLKSWAKPKPVHTPLLHFPGKCFIYPEPYGVVLIISPWNYPFMLAFIPLIGAIAAGNCALIKPSSVSVQTSTLIAGLVKECFEPSYIDVIQLSGDRSHELISQKFDFIFYTGSPAVGRTIMSAAAKNLTPVVLELGGKSPCVVDTDINLWMTARSITWGKFFNGGQTCVGVDYLLVNKKIKSDLLKEIKKCITEFYGTDPFQSPDLARLINKQQLDRMTPFLKEGKITAGGDFKSSELYIAPTLIELEDANHAVMREEIFGPVLPILEYETIDEAIEFINKRPKPLALYLFTRDQTIQQRFLRETSSGGLCINDTLLQFSTRSLPLGGVGESGMGQYHGKMSFDAFSHRKSVLKKRFLIDIFLRYPPFRKFGKVIKLLLKLANS